MYLHLFRSRIGTPGSNSLASDAGIGLKSSASHFIALGSICVVLSSSLWGQVSPPVQKVRGFPEASAAASAPQPLAPSANRPHDGSFIIGNDDVLAINVWKEPDLTRSTGVRSDGKISLPLVGEIQATGRTPLQLEQDIAAKLRNYITKPEVTIMVEQINSEKFNILGQVVKPGSYSLTLAPTVVDAIAIAGGTRDFAKQKSIYVLRPDSNGGESRMVFNYKDFIKGKGSQQNIRLRPHDTVIVP